MKHLSLIRHAKSSWADPGTTDFDRPLNDRGERDAPKMGQRLAARGAGFDGMLASPAARARRTAEILAEAVGFDVSRIDFDRGIYAASCGALLDRVRGLEDRATRVAIIGHNPAVTDLVNLLADARIGNVPTCGILDLAFEIENWSQVFPGGAQLLRVETPKDA